MKKKKPVTIKGTADLGELFDRSQLSIFKEVCQKFPTAFEDQEDFMGRLFFAVKRGLTLEEAANIIIRIRYANKWK